MGKTESKTKTKTGTNTETETGAETDHHRQSGDNHLAGAAGAARSDQALLGKTDHTAAGDDEVIQHLHVEDGQCGAQGVGEYLVGL